MLNLITHLDKQDASEQLDKAAVRLWKYLSLPRYKNEITKKLDRLIAQVTTQQYKIQNADGDTYLRHIAFLQYLKHNDKLQQIITAKPEDFNSIIKDISALILPDDFYTTNKSRALRTNFSILLKDKLFTYTEYRSSAIFEKVYKEIAIFPCTCAYCNTGEIISIKKKNTKKNTPSKRFLFDIDHFYPSVRYPYLALSFYNHIPACETCNEKFKNDAEVSVGSHFHPYHDCFDKSYTFKPKFNETGSDIKLRTVSLQKHRGVKDEMAQLLELESRYKESLTLAKANQLVERLHKNRHKLLNNHPEQSDFLESLEPIFSGEREKILSAPYEKLKRDIAKYFDIQKVYIK